ncbi:MAG: 6,7-dimethyl-8-ribityllumazine synthase [Candidatus Omnitrophica bacterium]|nr:6,7-dimethyl-8-ribityllumazine synthase [Candidatus Omnitrophota bacterium]
MSKVIEGQLTAQGRKFVVIVARVNNFITKRLLDGCLDVLMRHGASKDGIDVVWVPGAFEIPQLAARIVAGGKKYDAVICLGAVIRGATPHFEYIASEAAKGIAQVGLTSPAPVSFGIITADTIEQAIERAGTKDGNKGADAALSAIEMSDLYAQL